MTQFARVLTHRPPAQVRHFVGLPDAIAVDCAPKVPMPMADFLILVTTREGAFIERYTFSGEFAGDTWHRTIDEAHDFAIREFDGNLSAWESVPDNIPDPVSYLCALLESQDSLDSRREGT